MSLRTVCRLAGAPSSASRRLISLRDRLVHNTPSRIGSPAVNSVRICRKRSSSCGCRSIAAFRPPPFFSDPAQSGIVRLFELHQTPSDRFRINSEQFGDVLSAAMAQLVHFDPRIAPPILLRQRRKQPLHLQLYRFFVTVQVALSTFLSLTGFTISQQAPIRRSKSGSYSWPNP